MEDALIATVGNGQQVLQERVKFIFFIREDLACWDGSKMSELVKLEEDFKENVLKKLDGYREDSGSEEEKEGGEVADESEAEDNEQFGDIGHRAAGDGERCTGLMLQMGDEGSLEEGEMSGGMLLAWRSECMFEDQVQVGIWCEEWHWDDLVTWRLNGHWVFNSSSARTESSLKTVLQDMWSVAGEWKIDTDKLGLVKSDIGAVGRVHGNEGRDGALIRLLNLRASEWVSACHNGSGASLIILPMHIATAHLRDVIGEMILCDPGVLPNDYAVAIMFEEWHDLVQDEDVNMPIVVEAEPEVSGGPEVYMGAMMSVEEEGIASVA